MILCDVELARMQCRPAMHIRPLVDLREKRHPAKSASVQQTIASYIFCWANSCTTRAHPLRYLPSLFSFPHECSVWIGHESGQFFDCFTDIGSVLWQVCASHHQWPVLACFLWWQDWHLESHHHLVLLHLFSRCHYSFWFLQVKLFNDHLRMTRICFVGQNSGFLAVLQDPTPSSLSSILDLVQVIRPLGTRISWPTASMYSCPLSSARTTKWSPWSVLRVEALLRTVRGPDLSDSASSLLWPPALICSLVTFRLSCSHLPSFSKIHWNIDLLFLPTSALLPFPHRLSANPTLRLSHYHRWFLVLLLTHWLQPFGRNIAFSIRAWSCDRFVQRLRSPSRRANFFGCAEPRDQFEASVEPKILQTQTVPLNEVMANLPEWVEALRAAYTSLTDGTIKAVHKHASQPNRWLSLRRASWSQLWKGKRLSSAAATGWRSLPEYRYKPS